MTDSTELIDAEAAATVLADSSAPTDATAPKGEMAQPKRPLSAYNYFFRSERARLVGVDLDLKEIADVHNRKKRRHRKTHGKMGFREMANKVGERWRTLSDEEKAPFIKMFEDDRNRYKNELKVWNELQKEKKREHQKREKEAAKLAKAEEKKKKKLEKQRLLEEKKAAKTASPLDAATPALQREVSVLDSNDDADGMDDIIDKALDILNGEDFTAMSTMDSMIPGAPVEEDATADYINRAMDMLSDDIPADIPKPVPGRKRGRESMDVETSKMLQNSMSLNTVMDFDRFLEEFDDENFVSDDSSQGEGDDGEEHARGKSAAPLTKKTGKRLKGNTTHDMFDEVLLDGIEPVSVGQRPNTLNALENDLNTLGQEGWSSYGQMMKQMQLPMPMMKTALIPEMDGNLGYGSSLGQGFGGAFSSQYKNLLSLGSRDV